MKRVTNARGSRRSRVTKRRRSGARSTARQGTGARSTGRQSTGARSTARQTTGRRKTGRRDSGRARGVIIEAVGGASELAGATVEGISRTVARAIAGLGGIADSFRQALFSTAHGTLQAAIEMGGDLAQAARGIVLGVVRGEGRGGGLRSIEQTAEAVIRATARLSGDLGQAAKGLIEGAIHGAREIGLDAAEAAGAAATGAVRAAGDISAAAGEKVREAVVGTIQGVKVVLKEPFRSEPEPGRRRRRPGA